MNILLSILLFISLFSNSMADSTQGTWFGLPDFGITEMFSNPGNTTFYNPRTTNLNPAIAPQSNINNPPANTSTYNPNLGYPTSQAGASVQSQGPVAPTQQPSGGGGGGGIPSGVTERDAWARANGYTGYQDYLNNQQSQQGPSDAYKQQQEGMINSQFGEYFSNLDRQIGALPGEEQLQAGKVNNMATSQAGDINLGNQQTAATIDKGIGTAQQNKATSIRDLEGDMRSSLFAGNQYLGARGAGDSSAANMYSFALSKQANKGKSGILQTFNKTLGELDQKKVELQNITNQEMTKLKTWKDNALLDVTNYINQKKDALMNMVSQGKIDQATAIRELNTNIYNQAQQRLAAIDQQATAFNQGMQSWATQRAAALDDYKLQLTKQANFSVPDVINSEMMAFAPQGSGSYNGTQQFGQIGTQKKDQYGRLI